MIDTTNWAKFSFTVKGVEFVSMLDPMGSFYPQLTRIPLEVFEAYHNDMVSELIGDPSLMTRPEIQAELDRVNEGANQAILALA